MSIGPTVTIPFQSCGGHATLSLLNYSHKFITNKDSSCNARSYGMLIPCCLKFSTVFLSRAVAWMFSPIYTGTVGSLFGEW